MQGESETDERRSDTWWATLAARLLHPVQLESIEAFSYIGLPLCVADLMEIVEKDIGTAHLGYHIVRLRKIGALDFACPQYPLNGFMDTRYRLTPERHSR